MGAAARGRTVVHRWSGRIAVPADDPGRVPLRLQARLPDATTTRVAAHSFLGVAFYGAFVTKVLVVRMHRFPSLGAAARGRPRLRRADRRLVDELVLVLPPGGRGPRVDSLRGLRAHRRAAADPGHRPRLRGRARPAGRDRERHRPQARPGADRGDGRARHPRDRHPGGVRRRRPRLRLRGARLRGDRARRGGLPDADLRPRRAQLAARCSSTGPRSRSSATSSRRRRARSSAASG